MLIRSLHSFIFLTLVLVASQAQAADLVYSEVLLKKLGQRIERLLVDSYEAQVFLDQDLTAAHKSLRVSEITWLNTFSTAPYVYMDGSKRIALSQFYSFNGSLEQQVELVTEILFQIQRQLEGSTVSIPSARIRLFSKKFSPLLLEDVDSCSISISPLKARLGQSQRDEFTLGLVSLLTAKGFAYESTWGSNALVVEGNETTDAGCRGKNRNIMTMKAWLVSIPLQESKLLAEVAATSCGYSTKHQDEATKGLLKKLKNTLTKCTRAFGN